MNLDLNSNFIFRNRRTNSNFTEIDKINENLSAIEFISFDSNLPICNEDYKSDEIIDQILNENNFSNQELELESESSSDDPQNACSTYCEVEIMIKKLKYFALTKESSLLSKVMSINHLFTEAFIKKSKKNKANNNNKFSG